MELLFIPNLQFCIQIVNWDYHLQTNDNSDINFERFYFKRFFRIIPAFIVVLVLYYVLGDLKDGTGLPPLWKFLTFTQNYGLDYQTQKSFSHAWSLCVEEQFYLLLPMLVMLFFRNRIQKIAPYLLMALIGIGIFIRMYNWNEFVQPHVESGNRMQMFFSFLEKIYYPTHNRMDGLIIGVLIAIIFVFKPKIEDFLIKKGNVVLVIGLVTFLLAYQICSYGNSNMYIRTIFGYPLISFAYGLILISAISPNSILYKLKSRITFIIATLSYSIYLTHKLLYHLVKTYLKGIENDFLNNHIFLICLVVALIGGMILYYLIEKPFLILRERIINWSERDS